MSKYAIKMNDGTVAVMHLLAGTPQEAIDKWPDAEKSKVVSYQLVTDDQLPQDRYFRGAWGHDLKVDISKAREIHMNKIRAARDLELAKLDIETLRGNDVQAQKQVLRDIPQNFDLTVATTPEELKALWPEELKPRN